MCTRRCCRPALRSSTSAPLRRRGRPTGRSCRTTPSCARSPAGARSSRRCCARPSWPGRGRHCSPARQCGACCSTAARHGWSACAPMADSAWSRTSSLTRPGGARCRRAGWPRSARSLDATAAAARPRISAYTRFYRLRTGEPPAPLNRGNAAGGFWSHFLAILHPGDNGTFTVCLGVLTDDAAMKGLRREPAFDAAVASIDILAAWLAPGVSQPISGVRAHSCPASHLRGPDILGGEHVQSMFPIGDAACVTNPVYGRGVSLALAHAYRLADVLDAVPRVGAEQARRRARVTASLMTPWHRQGKRDDEELLGVWRATIHGEQPPAPPVGRLPFGAVAMAAVTDPVVWRRALRVQMCLDEPDTLYTDEEIRARVEKAQTTKRPNLPGPDRAELVALVAAAG